VQELVDELNDYRINVGNTWTAFDQLVGPSIDSMYALVRTRAQAMARTVSWDTVRGRQADAGLILLIRAGDTAGVERLLRRRLAEPHLRVQDSAYTLLTVVNTYAKRCWPADLVHATHFTRQLDALSAGAAFWQAQAHQTLAIQHFYFGKPEDVLDQVGRLVRDVARLEYLDRKAYISGWMNRYWTRFGDMYEVASDAALSLPDGNARMAAIDRELMALTVVPKSLVARDSSWATNDRGFSLSIRMMTEARIAPDAPEPPPMGHLKVGHKMPPLYGSIWRNVADTGPHGMTFGDGHVHIVSWLGLCTYLPQSARFVERMQQLAPGLEGVLYCSISGQWANVYVTPAEEVAALQAHLDAEYHSKVPVAIWVGEKQKTRNGGWLPAGDPRSQIFFSLGGAIDKQGRFRKTFWDPQRDPGEDYELHAMRLRQLIAEPFPAAAANPPASSPGATTSSVAAQ